MKFPWDKIKLEKVKPGEKQDGNKPNLWIMDEIGHSETTHIITNTELKYEVKSYPDGSKYAIVKEINSKMIFRLNSYEDLWILGQIHDVVKSAGFTVQVTIPFLIDSQADRRFDINQPHGLKLVCNFLNGLENFNYRIFHPHNPEVVEALLDRVEIVDNKSFINSVLHSISELWGMNVDPDNLILMSSDAGGFKPLMKLADKLKWNGETFSASKSRKCEEGKSKIVQQIDRQDFEGKDILIVDDICVYGGTFKGLSKMLKERNCGKLYLAVSHMTVRDLGDDPVTDYFDKIYTTNSKGFVYKKCNNQSIDNLEVISLF